MFAIIVNPEFLHSIYGVGEKLIQELQTWNESLSNKILLESFSSAGILPIIGTKQDN